MRLLGCLIVSLCILLFSVSYKLKLEQKSRQWREMKELLRLCLEELQVSQGNSEEILRNIWTGGFHCRLLEQILAGDGTLQQNIFAASESLCDPKLQEITRHFALRFGMSSLEPQMENLQTLLLICTEEHEKSSQSAKQNGKLALNLGLFGGAAVFIMLL